MRTLSPMAGCVLLASLFASSQSILAATALRGPGLYASPTGNDRNPGTPQRPIRTLEHARDLVRRINRNMGGDVTVYLHGGTYRLTQPLILDASDSGSNGYNVIYTAVAGEQPVISGGVAVTGWKQVDARRNLWAAPAPAGLNNTRQFYVNGMRALRTRGRLPVDVTTTPTGYTTSSPLMSNWRNQSDIEFVYTGGNALWSEGSFGLGGWTEPRCPVASIQGTTITMAQPCWDNSTKRVMLPESSGFKRTANLVGPASVGKQPAYVENAFELLGTPGQWYLDRSTHTIYYVPRAGEDLRRADVEVPVLETLIAGRGTVGHPIHNLVFSDLRFSYATWLLPSTNEGFSEIQANYMVTGEGGYATQGLCSLAPNGQCPFGAWTKTPGNVSFSFDNQIQFLNDAFLHLGGAGLELGNGSQADTVEGCIFTDNSANGLELGGVDLPLGTGDEATRDNVIHNNYIHEVGVEYHGGVGICVGYAQRTKIEHNQINHMPYTGISMGWGGWPDKIQQAGQANNSQRNLVAHNLIFDHMLVLADGGGIYTQGLTGPTLDEGEQLIGNVIYNQFSSGHGIYTDNGCKNVTAMNNVLFHTNHDNWGSRHKDYYNGQAGQDYDAFRFEHNYWQQGDADSSKQNVTIKDNHLINALSQAPVTILQDAGLEPAYKHLLNEQLEKPTPPEAPLKVAVSLEGGIALVTWSPSILQGNSPVQSYTVSSSQGDKVNIAAADFQRDGLVKIPRLANGKQYAFTVTATNAAGNSPPSLPSRPLTLEAKTISKPEAPANVSARAGDGMVSIHFQAPENTSSPIMAYTFTVNPGGRKITLTGRKVLVLSGKHSTFDVVDGLENGKSYTFDVAAVNAAGEGAVAITNAVTPTAYSSPNQN